MPISVVCSGCSTKLKIRDDLAGKKVKCPRCAVVNLVPPPEEDFVETEIVEEQRVTDAPAKPKASRPREEAEYDDDEEEDERPVRKPARKPARRDEEDEPEERIVAKKGSRARRVDEDEEEDDLPRRSRKRKGSARDDDDDDDDRTRKSRKFKACPRCGARDPKRVLWTAWGSFYGPAIFSHVRCQDCDYAYNGKTGGSNLLPAIVLVTLPLLGICAIIGAVIYLLMSRGRL